MFGNQNKSLMFQIYYQLRHTVSWLHIQNRMRMIVELKSIRVIKVGSKVTPILYDKYDIPREWERNDNYPICDMV
jgi:hypothetical protein